MPRRKKKPETDRSVQVAAKAILNMKKPSWVALIATASVTEIIELAREYERLAGRSTQ